MSLTSQAEHHEQRESVQYCYARHPVEEIEPLQSTVNAYREASLKSLFIINRTHDFIMDSKNKVAACWQTAFALGLACCNGISMTKAGEICGVSRACISKGARRFCELNDLPPSFYMKSEDVVEKSRAARKHQLNKNG